MDMFKKAKEEIETGRSAIKSAALLSLLALAVAYVALLIALETRNG